MVLDGGFISRQGPGEGSLALCHRVARTYVLRRLRARRLTDHPLWAIFQMNFFRSSLWSPVSVVVTAVITAWITTWITQRIVSRREKQKKIDETKLAIFTGLVPYLAELYARAAFPGGDPYDEREFLKKRMEILGTIQMMGPDEALDAFSDFCDAAEQALKREPSFDPDAFHKKFTRMNYVFCCEIHGEAIEGEQEGSRRPRATSIGKRTEGGEQEKSNQA